MAAIDCAVVPASTEEDLPTRSNSQKKKNRLSFLSFLKRKKKRPSLSQDAGQAEVSNSWDSLQDGQSEFSLEESPVLTPSGTVSEGAWIDDIPPALDEPECAFLEQPLLTPGSDNGVGVLDIGQGTVRSDGRAGHSLLPPCGKGWERNDGLEACGLGGSNPDDEASQEELHRYRTCSASPRRRDEGLHTESVLSDWDELPEAHGQPIREDDQCPNHQEEMDNQQNDWLQECHWAESDARSADSDRDVSGMASQDMEHDEATTNTSGMTSAGDERAVIPEAGSLWRQVATIGALSALAAAGYRLCLLMETHSTHFGVVLAAAIALGGGVLLSYYIQRQREQRRAAELAHHAGQHLRGGFSRLFSGLWHFDDSLKVLLAVTMVLPVLTVASIFHGIFKILSPTASRRHDNAPAPPTTSSTRSSRFAGAEVLLMIVCPVLIPIFVYQRSGSSSGYRAAAADGNATRVSATRASASVGGPSFSQRWSNALRMPSASGGAGRGRATSWPSWTSGSRSDSRGRFGGGQTATRRAPFAPPRIFPPGRPCKCRCNECVIL